MEGVRLFHFFFRFFFLTFSHFFIFLVYSVLCLFSLLLSFFSLSFLLFFSVFFFFSLRCSCYLLRLHPNHHILELFFYLILQNKKHLKFDFFLIIEMKVPELERMWEKNKQKKQNAKTKRREDKKSQNTKWKKT